MSSAVVRFTFPLRGRRSKQAASLSRAALTAVFTEHLAPFGGVSEVLLAPPSAGMAYVFAVLPASVDAGATAAALHMAPCVPLRGLRLAASALSEDAATAVLAGRASAPAPGATCAPADCASAALPPVPGLLLVREWVSEAEEGALLAALRGLGPWDGALASRRVLHLGAAFDYVTRGVAGGGAPAAALPSGGPLAAVLAEVAQLGLLGDGPDAPSGALAGRGALLDLLASRGGGGGGVPVSQVTVNEYNPGNGISPHVDTHSAFQDGILSLSLGGDVCMEFSLLGRRSDDVVPFQLFLPRRSLLVLRGEARFGWAHGIARRRTDKVDGVVRPRGQRVSVTMRAARLAGAPCKCAWPLACDEQEGGAAEPQTLRSPALLAQRAAAAAAAAAVAAATAAAEDGGGTSSSGSGSEGGAEGCGGGGSGGGGDDVYATPRIEAEHVHALYDSIAEHFSATRHSPWPRVAAYLRALPASSLVLDVGAGNGKYLAIAKDAGLPAFGVDRCAPLADICGGRGQQAAVGDALRVPVRSGAADAVLSVAVLHHLSTQPRRVAAVAELLRCVRPGGQVLIYAWAKEQGVDSRREFAAADVLVPWCLKRHFVRGGGGGGGSGGSGNGVDGTATAAAAVAPLAPPLPPGAVVDEARDVIVLQRYCHVHTRGEVEALLAAAAAQLGGRLEAGEAALPAGAGGAGEELTAQLAAHAAGLLPRRVQGAAEGLRSGGGPSFRILLSWWEADNHACLVSRDPEC